MFTLPELPYGYEALEPYIDEVTMHLHHDKHHATYVTNLNDALLGQDKFLNMTPEELMKNLNDVPEAVKTKVKNNGGGHVNHSFFWESMRPAVTNNLPMEKVSTAINSAFGDFVKFQEAFLKAALGRFGSGWVWLVKDAEDRRLKIEDSPNQDNPWMEGKNPILGLDVWEHAYYLKYQNRRAEYVSAFWNVVNWEEVEKKFLTFK